MFAAICWQELSGGCYKNTLNIRRVYNFVLVINVYGCFVFIYSFPTAFLVPFV